MCKFYGLEKVYGDDRVCYDMKIHSKDRHEEEKRERGEEMKKQYGNMSHREYLDDISRLTEEE
jgi:hypothetical protein